ncbi:MAG TPA: hypothetical protein VKB55_03565 [Nocardioidaceae bacterium]|nr:hypothetical protein [Nocardioidaceae bacterium]
MRRFVGIMLMLIAVIAAAVGAGLAILLGTDNRTATGPHPIETDAPIVVTRPDVLGWAGPTVTLTIHVAPSQKVFVGAANAVDLADYVGSVRRTEVTDYGLPWKLQTANVSGQDALPLAPGDLDWWVARASGKGSATMTVKLPDQAFGLAVIAVGGGDLKDLEVTAAYELDGGFGIGLGLLGFAVGLGLFGWLAFQGRPMTRELADDEADDDGESDEGEPDDAAADKADDEADDAGEPDEADDIAADKAHDEAAEKPESAAKEQP